MRGPRSAPASMRRRNARVLSSTEVMSNTVVKPQRLNELLCTRVACVKKGGGKDVDMAVPKTCGNDKAFAVNYPGRARDFGRRTRSQGKNMTVMDEDRSIFN